MAPPSLETLSNELLSMILESLHAPADLRALNRASPQCYRNFRNRRWRVISAIVRNVVPYENLPLALAACDASAVADFASSYAPTGLGAPLRYKYQVWSRICQFKADHADGHVHQDLNLDNTAIWTPLHRLCDTTELLIEMFHEDSFQGLSQLAAFNEQALDGAEVTKELSSASRSSESSSALADS